MPGSAAPYCTSITTDTACEPSGACKGHSHNKTWIDAPISPLNDNVMAGRKKHEYENINTPTHTQTHIYVDNVDIFTDMSLFMFLKKRKNSCSICSTARNMQPSALLCFPVSSAMSCSRLHKKPFKLTSNMAILWRL